MSDRPSWDAGVKPGAVERGSSHVLWLMGQMFMIPVAAMVYSVDLLVRAMQGMQRAANRGLDVAVGHESQPPAENVVGPVSESTSESLTPNSEETKIGVVRAATIQKEEKTLGNDGGVIALDKDLHDDMLKLVRYKILFVKREYEHAFPEQEDLVSDNMDGSAFTAWKVAEFIQHLARGTTLVPEKWGERYPSDRDKFVRDGKLIGFPDHDKKYLRVYFEVLDRYPREKFKYEEKQIEVLKEIRDKL